MNFQYKVELTTHNLHFHDQASIYSVDSKDRMIATAGGDHDVRIWLIEKLGCKNLDFCHTNALNSSVKIQYKYTLSGHTKMVNCVRFSDEYLASGSDGGAVLIWDINKFDKGLSHCVRKSDGDDVYEVAWHKNFLFLGLSSGQISVYKISKTCEDSRNEKSENNDNSHKFCILENEKIQIAEGEAEKNVLEQTPKKKAKLITSKVDTSVNIEHVQTMKAHSDIIQGLSFNHFYSILATQSKDCTSKIFYFDQKLNFLCKNDNFNDKKIIFEGKSFYKRLSFVKKNFLFLPSCSLDNENVVFVYAYPFREIYSKIGPFDSAVQKVHEWQEGIVFITKKSCYLIREKDGTYESVFHITDTTFLPTTDACSIENLLIISSLDGFIASLRLEKK